MFHNTTLIKQKGEALVSTRGWLTQQKGVSKTRPKKLTGMKGCMWFTMEVHGFTWAKCHKITRGQTSGKKEVQHGPKFLTLITTKQGSSVLLPVENVQLFLCKRLWTLPSNYLVSGSSPGKVRLLCRRSYHRGDIAEDIPVLQTRDWEHHFYEGHDPQLGWLGTSRSAVWVYYHNLWVLNRNERAATQWCF